MPYENALSAYCGNCARVARDGKSGSTRPLAASSPVQSCAPTITSGAVDASTVLRSSRIFPKSFWTTLTSMPRAAPQADATRSTAALRSASVQIVTFPAGAASVVAPVGAAELVDAPATDATATAESPAAKASKRLLWFMWCLLGVCAGLPTNRSMRTGRLTLSDGLSTGRPGGHP